jgi:hypothetical protein
MVLAGPKEGLVRGAYISAVINGPPATGSIRAPRFLYARFPFVALPRQGRRITVEWITPLGRQKLSRPRLAKVGSYIRAPDGGRFGPGAYSCTLRVGGRALERVGILVR